MAKKAVASFKKEGKAVSITKVIKMVKSEKTGAYIFKEEVMLSELVKDFISKKEGK